MNDIEKMLKAFEYIQNPDKISKDVNEFVDVVQKFASLFRTTEDIYGMSPVDIGYMVLVMKEFSDSVKPFVIKYGILPNVLKGDE